MLTYLQAIVLGLIQGATELFPVSSLGHSVIIPALFHWDVSRTNDFLIFLVATHLATSLVLLAFFFRDWLKILTGMWSSLREREIKADNIHGKLGWLIVVGTIPAGILGLLFEDKLKTLFALPRYAALFLVVNGMLLLAMEAFKKKKGSDAQGSGGDIRISRLTWTQSIKIGFAQCLALIPGISRTGSTLGGGLLIGLSHEDAARFSFLLATPIIFAASALKLPELITSGTSAIIGPIIIGSLASAIAAYFSVRFLTRYFKTNSLKPFAVYCLMVGAVCSVVFLLN